MKSASKRQGTVRAKCPAKVTTWLQVLRQRSDGYHDVRLGLVPVSLYDTLELWTVEGAGCTLTVDGKEPLGAERENLVWRAAEAFREAGGDAPGVTIHLVKGIPAGAGLGGGSADAAVTLLALNALARKPLSAPVLAGLAARLGSDVPFFLDPRPSLATGRGERLQALPGFPPAPLLIVKPRLSIATADAYARVTPRERPAATEHERAPRSLEELIGLLENDFEAALFPAYPELGEIKARLLAEGAAGALLSGTGSALFGLFHDPAARDRAARALSAKADWRVLPCEVLPRHEYGLEASDD